MQAQQEIAARPVPHDRREEDHTLVIAVVVMLIFAAIMLYLLQPVFRYGELGGNAYLAGGFGLVFGGMAFMSTTAYLYSAWTRVVKRVYSRMPLRPAGPLPGEGGRLRAGFELPAIPFPSKADVALLNYGVDVQATGGSMRIHRHAAGGGTLEVALDVPAGRPAQESKEPRWQLRMRFAVQRETLDLLYDLDLPAHAGARAVSAEPPATQSAPAPAAEAPDRASLWVLVGMNLAPAIGAAFFGLRVQDLVMLYWMENLVIGFFHAWRIRLIVPPEAKVFMPGVFVLQYGFFCALHGVILAALFRVPEARFSLAGSVAEALNDGAGVLALLALVVVHGYNFTRHSLARREYSGDGPLFLMTRPYKRILVVHLFVMIGGLMFTLGAGATSAAMAALFVGIKTALELWTRRRLI